MSTSSAPQNHTNTMCSFLSWLPLELRCRTVSFLNPPDALAFSEHLGTDFGVTVSRLDPQHRIFQSVRWTGDRVHGDDPVCSNYRLPVLQGGPVQSAVLSFRWRDQGFGVRKGKLYIVASTNENSNSNNSNSNNDAPAVPTLPFGGGRVVCETELATHHLLPNEMVFFPRESEVLTLWYKCGSGQIGHQLHQLHVEECSIRVYVFDDPEHNWANNYQRLHDLGAVGFPAQNGHQGGAAPEDEGPRPPSDNFFPKMLLRVCKSLRRQLQASKISKTPLDTEMVDFMNEYNIPVTDISLRSVEEMIKADMEERSAFYKSQRIAREANRARQEQQQRNGGGGGGRFAFGPFMGGNGEAGIMFGGGMDLPDDIAQMIFGGGAAGAAGVPPPNIQPVPIPDAFGAVMQDFIGHMNQMMVPGGLDDDDDDDEDEEEDEDDEDDEDEEGEEDLSDDEAIIVD